MLCKKKKIESLVFIEKNTLHPNIYPDFAFSPAYSVWNICYRETDILVKIKALFLSRKLTTGKHSKTKSDGVGHCLVL